MSDNAARPSTNPEALEIMHELSTLLDCGLDRQALQAAMELLESGVSAEALATAVIELRRKQQQATADVGVVGSTPRQR
eukprot:CAMPEP_0196818044 /NCGR_PEP_ID=MMETSP1362-20130617/63760_1 /TAXON_ID=163516 /ORGANISM="Leptocylindrus danicus, Strain CCMP1856" /LENGTH=78 /DNA_ID=CAMNT_0042195961 /DNA_START=18 /DNA_END=254 /DNA_ORIENTATION=-